MVLHDWKDIKDSRDNLETGKKQFVREDKKSYSSRSILDDGLGVVICFFIGFFIEAYLFELFGIDAVNVPGLIVVIGCFFIGVIVATVLDAIYCRLVNVRG